LAGDETLKLIAATIQDSIPEFAIASRYAGDQFTILVPDFHIETIAELAREINARLVESGCPVAVSAGCAEFPRSSSMEDGLVLASELALARAKQLGGAQVCTFDAVPGADQAADPFLLYQSVENGSFATIQALAAAVDAKDAYTNGHSARVAQYASALSAAVGDSPELVDRVFRCGTLHDVGKIGVPDAVLKKPGRLDPDEQRVMETHPVLGEMIAGKVPQLADLLPGVRHHHERWDGQGYPDRLAGEAIPYIARVLAVADTYDAMTSDRPYRKGLAIEIALGEIEKHAGTQFDPRLAAAFVEFMRAQNRQAA
jgi:HD-GYP domain-containing protein (c-di-GMP phosphodiesterase class II)